MSITKPNILTKVKINADIPITIGISAFAFAACSISLFLSVPKEYKQDVAFGSGIIASASAIYGAFYAGRALHQNIYSRKIDRTVECSVRWLDSGLTRAKILTSSIAKEAVKCQSVDEKEQKIKDLINGTPEEKEEKELAIATVFNFFEQLAVFVENDVVDETLLQEFYLTIIVKYYVAFQPWIEEKQKKTDKALTSQRIYKNLTTLYERWKDLLK